MEKSRNLKLSAPFLKVEMDAKLAPPTTPILLMSKNFRLKVDKASSVGVGEVV